MGNRAVLAFVSMPDVGIYIHWNGGLESVLAFLEATKLRGARCGDAPYAMARLIQTIGDFFPRQHGSLLHVGVGPLSTLDSDNGDNGLYWISDDLSIVRRDFVPPWIPSGGFSKRLTYGISVDDIRGRDKEKYLGILATLGAVDAARDEVHDVS